MADGGSSSSESRSGDSDLELDEVAISSLPKWKFIEETTAKLEVDDVEAFLLVKARQEAPRVIDRLMVRMYGTQQELAPAEVPVADIMRAWLDPSVLMLAKQHINANLGTGVFTSVAEVKAFLQVELWLCFYNVSPTKFYDPLNKAVFPPVKKTMKQRRYFALLNALGTQSGKHSGASETWNAPFEHDRQLSHAIDSMRRVCSDIGFVNGVSIASLDDDLLRLRSSKVDDLGFTRTRNPAKGFGPVEHGVVSLATGLFLGGHVASRGENTVDVVRIIMRSLCGVSTDSQIRLPGVIFALDRGYQSKEVNQQIMECGAAIIGTHKRNGSFPFTYGKAASKRQKWVSEKGAKTTKWATSTVVAHSAQGKSTTMMHALAYRDDLGKVVLCNTSVKFAGPGKWIYISGQESRLSSGCQFQDFEKLVVKLTQCQRTPDWFVMRKFRVTGLVEIELLRSLANYSGSSRNDENGTNLEKYYDLAGHTSVQLLLKRLSIPISGESRSCEPAPDRLSRAVLDKAKNKELRQLCRDRGITTSGNKRELIGRLLNPKIANLRRGGAARGKSPEASLLAAWFMTPKSSTDMKIGSKNETNICSRVIAFFERYSCFRIVETRSYGLLCRKDHNYLAFSPDDIALVAALSSEDRYYAVLEYKTRTRAGTIESESDLAERWGRFASITLESASDSVNFKQLIPEQGHRSQLLHNIIGGSLRDGFIIYASPTSIIRVVHVTIGADIEDAYLLAFMSVKEACLEWIYSPDTPIPAFTTEALGHCEDASTLCLHLSLWHEINAKVDELGRPLPPAKHIIPTAIATWNRVKGGIDVYSCFLKNIKSRHEHLPPLAAIWQRFLLTLVYNAFQSFQLLQSATYLTDEVRCKTYSNYQQHKSERGTIHDFCRDAASCLGVLVSWDDDELRQALTEIDANTGSTEAMGLITPKPRSFAYHVRDLFNDDAEWRKLRLTNYELHNEKLLPNGKQLRCILCCKRDHGEENVPHSRLGYKTRYQCSICKVALCHTERWENGQSCFDRFHEDANLPVACRLMTKKSKQIRAPPPSRKRSSSSLEQNEREVPRHFAKPLHLIAQTMAHLKHVLLIQSYFSCSRLSSYSQIVYLPGRLLQLNPFLDLLSPNTGFTRA